MVIRRWLMPSFLPWSSQRRVLRGAGRCGHTLALLVVLGLVLAWQIPLPAAEQPDRGGTIIWAVHEGMPSFDIHAEGSYILAQPVGPLYNGLLTFDLYN